jgi:subtilisin family serine protease
MNGADDGVNYELSAPGANIESSVIGGNYKAWNGTSMAAPLVAGGISAMQMVKSYDSQEVLWGDLIHSCSTNIDFKTAYNITSRPC